MGRVIVFAGPCLPDNPTREWADLLDQVDLWPPAERGDVLVACAERPDTIVLLDGYYYTVPAVTHKELLYALQAGIRVLGGASMGALRALELAPFGMEGVGRVFRWFRSGALDGDDEVALLHAPADLGYAPLTIALVELRYAVRAEGVRAHTSARQRQKFIQAVKALPFARRTSVAVTELGDQILGPTGRTALEEALGLESIKTRDALATLKVALHDEKPGPERVEPLVTGYASTFREWYLRVPPYQRQGSARRTYLKAWNVVQVLHPESREFARRVRTRYLVASAGRRAGLEVRNSRHAEIRSQLETHLGASRHGAKLPEPEVEQEAEDHGLAEAAISHFGSVDAALASLLAELGLDDDTPTERLVDLLRIQDDLMPPWLLLRAFVFSSALDPAMDLADCAADIDRAFRFTAGGARVSERDVLSFAQQLWQCSPEAVQEEATLRGLYRSHGAHDFSPGLRGTLERLVIAERLDPTDSDYAALRSRMTSTAMSHVLD